jgi:hypothetical protein
VLMPIEVIVTTARLVSRMVEREGCTGSVLRIERRGAAAWVSGSHGSADGNAKRTGRHLLYFVCRFDVFQLAGTGGFPETAKAVQTRSGMLAPKRVFCFPESMSRQAHLVSHHRAHTVRVVGVAGVADLSNNLRATNKCR